MTAGAGEAEEVMSPHCTRSFTSAPRLPPRFRSPSRCASRPRGVSTLDGCDLVEADPCLPERSLCARLDPLWLAGGLGFRARLSPRGAPVTSAHAVGPVSSGAPVSSAHRLLSLFPLLRTLLSSLEAFSLLLSSSFVSLVRRALAPPPVPRSLPSQLLRRFCVDGLAFAKGGGIDFLSFSTSGAAPLLGASPAEDGLLVCFFFAAGSEGSRSSRRPRE